MKAHSNSPVPQAVWLIAVAAVALHLYAAPQLEYHRDELLYFALGYHPAWGYASVPPLIGWLAGAVRVTLGDGVLAVKFLPAVLSGVFVWLLALIAREMHGRGFAQILAATAGLVMPIALRSFHLFQPVHLDLLWWTLLTWLLLRYLNRHDRRYLVYLGVVAGLALLTKYLVLLWLAGLALGLVLFRFRTHREPYLYVGAGVALLIFLPNLLWQYVNDWPVVGHLSALSEKQLVNVSAAAFTVDLLTMPLTGLLLVVPGIYRLVRRQPVLAVAITFTLVMLIVLHGKSYYVMGVYPALVGAGAVWWEDRVGGTKWRYALPSLMVLLTLPVLPLGLPVCDGAGLQHYFAQLESDLGIQPGRRWEDGRIHDLPQDYADQIGWQELKADLVAAYASEPDPAHTVLYCENYGQAAALLQVAGRHGIPEAISFSDAFNFWLPDTLPAPTVALYYVNDEPASDLDDWFGEVTVVGQIENPAAREFGTTIYRYGDPLRPFNDFWTARLEERPSPY